MSLAYPGLQDPAVLAELDALDALEAANPAASFAINRPGVRKWGAAKWQQEVINDPSSQISILGANKVGKSTVLSWIIWSFLLDIHPVWRRPKGRDAVVVYLAANLDNAYANDVSRSLHDFHTPAIVKPRCTYSEERGYFFAGARMLATTHGRVLFYSGHQDPQALAGVWGDLVIVNELPTARHWGELMRSSTNSADTSPVIVGFTAVPPETVRHKDDLSWYWKDVDDPEKQWKQYVIPLRAETTPHRTEESRQRQIQRTLEWERAQRIEAARYGPLPSRSIANYDESRVWSGGWEDMPGAHGEVRLGLWADHGEIGGHEAIALAAWSGRGRDCTVWFVDEYQSPERTTIAMDAAAVLRMVERNGLTIEQIDEAIGDVNSAGKSALTSVNQELTRELAKQSGMRVPTFRNAQKGPGSVQYGVRVLDNAFGESRVWVHERCENLRRSLRRWQGDDDNFKHFVDLARYGAAPHLDPKRTTAPRRLARG